VIYYFLRLGLLGFGGPVALVGQMGRELAYERGWLTKEQMREAVAICQSLPGPLAIQVGIYISNLRAGFWGAWAGGWAFILPNFVIVAGLGALYVYLGDLKPVTAIFYGVSPTVIALILHSCWRLANWAWKTGCNGRSRLSVLSSPSPYASRLRCSSSPLAWSEFCTTGTRSGSAGRLRLPSPRRSPQWRHSCRPPAAPRSPSSCCFS
jgi:chromate transport protein ChrA